MKCADCGASNVPLRTEVWNRISIARCERCWKAWAGTYKPEALKEYEAEQEKRHPKRGDHRHNISGYGAFGAPGDVIYMMPGESEVYSGGETAPVTVQGLGSGAIPPAKVAVTQPEEARVYIIKPGAVLTEEHEGSKFHITNYGESTLRLEVAGGGLLLNEVGENPEDTTPTGCTAEACYQEGNFLRSSHRCSHCDHYKLCGQAEDYRQGVDKPKVKPGCPASRPDGTLCMNCVYYEATPEHETFAGLCAHPHFTAVAPAATSGKGGTAKFGDVDLNVESWYLDVGDED